MVHKMEIITCQDIDKLKELCINYRDQYAFVSAVLVDESKWHITPEQAIEKIRDYLVSNQGKLDIEI